jgi:LCP family protein required for cell wall assembly
VLTLALLGNDGDGSAGQRTDAIILAIIDTSARSATLLSIPRDLYVYHPGWRMDRINLAMPHGGPQQFRDTVRYNLGIEVDYYVRVGFGAFEAAVDALEGVTVPVLCPLEDWRLISADLDPTLEENWERFRLEPDLYTMDGSLALWYARSRMTTTDFDRSRRQQQLLHALLEKAISRNVLGDVPALWRAFEGQVTTDLPLTRMGQLAALAPDIRANGVRHLALNYNALQEGRIGPQRMWVWLIDWERAEPVLQAAFSPPALAQGQRGALPVTVRVENWVDYRLSAETLRWFGFAPRYEQTWDPRPDQTAIVWHGPNLRGSRSDTLRWIYRNAPVALSEEGTTGSYTVTLGHDFNPCRLP